MGFVDSLKLRTLKSPQTVTISFLQAVSHKKKKSSSADPNLLVQSLQLSLMQFRPEIPVVATAELGKHRDLTNYFLAAEYLSPKKLNPIPPGTYYIGP